MNPDIASALNDQIAKEFTAAFLYLSFSANMHQYGMNGAALWLRAQYYEECEHALRLQDYLLLRRIPVRMPVIDCQDYAWSSPLDVFRLALEHERMITLSIHNLLTLCRHEQDYATENLLLKYVDEQVEEEDSVENIVSALCRCANDESALMQLDARLGTARKLPDTSWN